MGAEGRPADAEGRPAGAEGQPMSAGGSWLIKGARPLGGDPADIGIRDGLVAGLGPGAAAAAGAGAQVLDAAGLVALPGLVDLHTHLREPGREDA
jgi:dihydroorotase